MIYDLDPHPLRTLSVCSGIGGLDAGLHRSVPDGTRTVCYVERDPYAVACLRTLIDRGVVDDAPIWDDLLTFDGRPWRGRVDLLAGGVPCQGNSQAGKGLGRGDPRHLWPAYFRVLREVRPVYALLENVRGLRTVEDGALFAELVELARSFDLDEKRHQLGEEGERALRSRARVRRKLLAPTPGTWISSERVTVAAGAMFMFHIQVVDPFLATYFSLSTDAAYVPSLSVTLSVGRDTFAYRVPASAFYARMNVDLDEPLERGAQIHVEPVKVFSSQPLFVTVHNDGFGSVDVRAAMFGRYLTDAENGQRLVDWNEIRTKQEKKT